MIFYSLESVLWMVAVAIVVDLCIGDPPQLPHPVVLMGRWIRLLERWLWQGHENRKTALIRGSVLVVLTLLPAGGAAWLIVGLGAWLHPFVGLIVNIWLISTTLAVKGLKDASMRIYAALAVGRIDVARKRTGEIVGRETDGLEEPELVRAAVETVAENIVDAFKSPVFFAILGGAPLAMLYRAVNTLDSMVGYRNERYLYFGRPSARLDDLLNWIPARLTGAIMVVAAWMIPGMSAVRGASAIRHFARRHPSPNSGIPESAAAGAMGVQLGGVNVYRGRIESRAQLGWAVHPLQKEHIIGVNRLLYATCWIGTGGVLCTAAFISIGG